MKKKNPRTTKGLRKIVNIEMQARQLLFNLFPVFFEPFGKHEGLAKLVEVLIDREAGNSGSHFEQYTAGLTEIDGRKIIPVKDRRGVEHPL